MTAIRIFLIAIWIATAFVTAQAVGSQGLDRAGDIFLADLLSGGWHAQFGVDFAGHLLLMCLWVAWRLKFSPIGIILAVLCVLGGGLFSFAYILIESIRVKGDIKRLLLGKHHS